MKLAACCVRDALGAGGGAPKGYGAQRTPEQPDPGSPGARPNFSNNLLIANC
jgi:hypothetical protein